MARRSEAPKHAGSDGTRLARGASAAGGSVCSSDTWLLVTPRSSLAYSTWTRVSQVSAPTLHVPRIFTYYFSHDRTQPARRFHHAPTHTHPKMNSSPQKP